MPNVASQHKQKPRSVTGVSVVCVQCRAGHVYNKFSWGNLKSLWEQPRQAGLDVRQKIIDFYRCAHGCVAGPHAAHCAVQTGHSTLYNRSLPTLAVLAGADEAQRAAPATIGRRGWRQQQCTTQSQPTALSSAAQARAAAVVACSPHFPIAGSFSVGISPAHPHCTQRQLPARSPCAHLPVWLVHCCSAQYSAPRMSLAVLGGQDLDTLESWVQASFGGILTGTAGPPASFEHAGLPFEVGGPSAVAQGTCIT